MKVRIVPIVLLGLLVPGCGEKPGPSSRAAVGARAPEFSLPTLDGTRLDSRALLGRTVVLNFWATWCQPCRREIPDLVALANAGRAEIIGIALDQEGERAVRPFVERHGIPYTVLLGNQEVFEHFYGVAIPYTLVLGPDHQIVSIYRGATSRTALEKDLDGLRMGRRLSFAGGVEVPARRASDPGAGRFLRRLSGGPGGPWSRSL